MESNKEETSPLILIKGNLTLVYLTRKLAG